jgi:hypothetical protein
MNAYLLAGLASKYYQGHYVDACSNVILYGGDEAAAWKAFEESLLNSADSEVPAPPRIQMMVGAPVLDQLLTETGNAPIQWPEVTDEILRILESTPMDSQEQGYWVECDECVRPDKLASGIEWLQRELPEDIRSGLNWSADKTYFFLISVLSPPAPPPEFVEDADEDRRTEEGQDEDVDASAESDLAERVASFPSLAKKELAVVVRARNSIVAAWLWRKYAASTPLARNGIRVDALCDVVGIGGETRANS